MLFEAQQGYGYVVGAGLGRIDKAIAILSNGSGESSASGKAKRAHAPRPMSAAMKAKIGRGVRKAFLQRKREAATKAKS